MRHAPRRRAALAAVIGLGLACSSGCTHNHYYYGAEPPAYVVPGESVIYEYEPTYATPGRIVSDGVAVVSDAASSVGSKTKSLMRSSASPRYVISEGAGDASGSGRWIAKRGSSFDRPITQEVRGASEPPLYR